MVGEIYSYKKCDYKVVKVGKLKDPEISSGSGAKSGWSECVIYEAVGDNGDVPGTWYVRETADFLDKFVKVE